MDRGYNLPKLKVFGIAGDWKPKLCTSWMFWFKAPNGVANEFWTPDVDVDTGAKTPGEAATEDRLPNANTGLAEVTAEPNPLGCEAS